MYFLPFKNRTCLFFWIPTVVPYSDGYSRPEKATGVIPILPEPGWCFELALRVPSVELVAFGLPDVVVHPDAPAIIKNNVVMKGIRTAMIKNNVVMKGIRTAIIKYNVVMKRIRTQG